MGAASIAYRAGLNARRSDEPEPRSPYEPGSQEYADFADGFCADPFPDRMTLPPKALTNAERHGL